MECNGILQSYSFNKIKMIQKSALTVGFFSNVYRSGELHNPFGCKRLSEFLRKTNDEVIMALDKSRNNFRQNLRKDCSDDVLILLIQIVGEKVCGETSLQEIQSNLVVLCTESLFLEKILKFTSQIPSLKTDEINR